MGKESLELSSMRKCEAEKRNLIKKDARDRNFVIKNVSVLIDDVSELLSLSTRLAGRVDKLKKLGTLTNDGVVRTLMNCFDALNTEEGQPYCSQNDRVRDEADVGIPETTDDDIRSTLGDSIAIDFKNDMKDEIQSAKLVECSKNDPTVES